MGTQKAEERILGKDDILKAQDLQCELTHCPEWGGSVWVQELTASGRDQVEDMLNRRNQSVQDVRATMGALTMVDGPGGKRLFDRPQDVKALGNKSGAALSRVIRTASRLSKLDQEQVDQMTENLPRGQSGGSPSD